ncbi:MAG TPA: c-type cytochrome [Bryobacteraceae bacterium]|nr:c-type cytochrome [Bryobacteraceae bacterium]
MNPGVVVVAAAFAWLVQSRSEPGPDIAAGRKIFESQCAVCHGTSGGGGRGPSLNTPKLEKAPDDVALRKLISEGIEPEMPAFWMLSARDLTNVAGFVRSLGSIAPERVAGDPVRGAAVYREKGCSGCHIIAGNGVGFGPELTAIGARRNAAHLRQALLEPAAFIPPEFVSVNAVTASGEAVSGIRVNEDSFTIQIKDSAGRFHSFRKAELKNLQILRDQSAMPPYAKLLRADELQDLVAYLASLRGRL